MVEKNSKQAPQIWAKRSGDLSAEARVKLAAQSVRIQELAESILNQFNPSEGWRRGHSKSVKTPPNGARVPSCLFSAEESVAAGLTCAKMGPTAILIFCSHRRAGGGWRVAGGFRGH